MSKPVPHPVSPLRRLAPLPGWVKLDRKSIVLLILLALAYLPLLTRLAKWLWDRDHYSFFPLGLVAATGLLMKAMAKPGDSAGAYWLRSALIRTALLLLLAATLIASPWLCGVSAMFMLMGIIYCVGGPENAKKALPAWLVLWMMVPLPLRIDHNLILSLQHTATRFSSGLLDLLGYRHVVDGVVLRLPTRIYQVEEACSGIQSLFSAMFCTGVYLVLNRAGMLRSLIVLAGAFFWVLAANISRIAAVVALKESFGLPVDEGFYHASLGVVFFLLTLVATFSTERLLNFVWPALELPYWLYEEAPANAAPKKWKQKPFSEFFAPGEWTILNILFGVIAVTQCISVAVNGSMAAASTDDIAFLAEKEATGLPDVIDGWTQVDYRYIQRDSGDINGEISRLWVLEKDGTRVEASVDGPYIHGWHYLSDCYRGQGWKDGATAYKSYIELGEKRGGTYLAFDLQKAPEEYGVVVTGLFDSEFRAFMAPRVASMQRHYGRLNDLKENVAALFGQGDPTVARSDSLSFQIQVFHHRGSPLTDEDREKCEDLFHTLRRFITQTKDTESPAGADPSVDNTTPDDLLTGETDNG